MFLAVFAINSSMTLTDPLLYITLRYITGWCTSGLVSDCWTCDHEVASSNLDCLVGPMLSHCAIHPGLQQLGVNGHITRFAKF